MGKEQFEIRTEVLRSRCKFNKAVKDCANYFLDKYYNNKAEGLSIKAEDL